MLKTLVKAAVFTLVVFAGTTFVVAIFDDDSGLWKRVYAPEQEEKGAPAAKIVVFEVVPSS